MPIGIRLSILTQIRMLPEVPYMKNLHIFVNDNLLALSFINILDSIVKFSGISV